MSAPDDYRAWCRKHVRTSPGFIKADAAIAELEEENELLRGHKDALIKRVAKAEANLAAKREMP